MIDELRELEDLKSAAAARQARSRSPSTCPSAASRPTPGCPPDRAGAGVGAQIALARRESPAKGGRLLGLAKALVTEMPHTLTALETGQLNEWRATLLVRETACLTPADRAGVDEELAPDTGTLDGAGDRAIIAAARAAAYRRDPRSVTQRAAHAATDGTSASAPPPTPCATSPPCSPSPGVAVQAALTRAADTLRTTGYPRTRGQAMADTLVERTTGTPGGITGIEIQLVMTDRTLLQADAEPARLPGYGTVPADWARELLQPRNHRHHRTGHGATEPGIDGTRPPEPPAGTRRPPSTSGSAGSTPPPAPANSPRMDSRARIFPPGLRRFIQTRDDTCRTPYCDAPIRHLDHIIPWHDGGQTTAPTAPDSAKPATTPKKPPAGQPKP